ncbi:MAG: carboxypeptidase regulatory-like domain-containing protein [Acidobacteriota bacterium]
MKGCTRVLWQTLLFVVVFTSSAWFAQAQATLATIRGTVTDAGGAVVPGVSVTVTNQATNVARTVVSGDRGNYEVTHLNPGVYRVSAELPGFKRFRHEDIEVRAIQTVRIDVRLEIGELDTEVTVEAGAPVIDSETPTIAQSRSFQQMRDLPTHIRGSGQLYQWTWLTPTGTQGAGSRRSFGGGRAGSVYFNVDGISSNSPAFANQTAVLNPPREAVQEVRFQYVNAKAEFGENGGVTAITKSGGNNFHGSFYWDVIHSALSARNFFAANRGPLDPQTGEELYTQENQLGGSVGGPIVRDKVFFFVSMEYVRDTSPAVKNINIPTLKMRQGDFSELLDRPKPIQLRDPLTGDDFPGNIIPPDRLNPGALAWQQRFYSPLIPNFGAPDSFAQNFRGSYSQLLEIPQFVNRLDFQTSDNNSLYWRLMYMTNPSRAAASQLPPDVSGFQTGRNTGTQMVVSDTWTLSPTLINEFKAGYARRAAAGRNLLLEGQVLIDELGVQGLPNSPGVPTIPDVRIQGFHRPTAGGNDYVEETYHFGNTLTWIKDRHTYKMGIEWLPQLYTSRQRPEFGRYDFTQAFSRFSYADFLLGLPQTTFRASLRDTIYMRYYWINGFFQDDFKITPTFTLHYGLRYDFNSPQVDKYDVFNGFDPSTGSILIPTEAVRPKVHPSIDAAGIPVLTAAQAGYPERSFLEGDKNNFAPRIGFAWRPFDDKTVIRSGYGIFYDNFTSGITANQIFSGPFEVDEQFRNRIQNGRPLMTLQNPFLETGTTGSVSLRFTSKDIVNPYLQQWNLTLERDLGFETALRLSYIGTKNTQITFNRNINQISASTEPFSADRRPYSLFNELLLTDNGGNSSYNALSVDFERKGGAGLYYQVNWTWAKNIGDVDDAGNIERGLVIENAFCRACERGNFQWTPRHRLIANLMWELPFGQGRRFLNQSGLGNHVLGGWQVNSVIHAQTGLFLTPSFAGSDPSNTDTVGGRPDRIADGNLPSDQRSIDGWFDASAFVVPPENAGRFGNAGKGIIVGPGRFVVDFGLHKRFQITEESWLRVQASATNVLNRANFDFPNVNISAPAARTRITSIYTRSDFAGPREIMLGLRFEF